VAECEVARLQQGSLEMESLCEEMSNHNQHLEDKLAAMEVEADFASQLLTDTSDANTQLTLNMETTKHQLQEQQAQGASLREEVGTKQEAWEQANLELARVTLALQDANTAAAALVCEHHAREQSYTAAATFLLACHNVKTMSMEAQHELSAGFFRLARGAHLHQARSPPKWPYPSRSGSPVSKLRQPQVAPIRERARDQAKEAGRWTRAIAAEHADPRLQEASRPSSRLEEFNSIDGNGNGVIQREECAHATATPKSTGRSTSLKDQFRESFIGQLFGEERSQPQHGSKPSSMDMPTPVQFRLQSASPFLQKPAFSTKDLLNIVDSPPPALFKPYM